MGGYILIPSAVFIASVDYSYRNNNYRKCKISNEILRIYIKKIIASSSNNIIILHSNTPFFSANNAESNAVFHDTMVCSSIFIFPTRTVVSGELGQKFINYGPVPVLK